MGSNREQDAPKPNMNPAVWGLVLLDMADRDLKGAEKYGTRLQPHNGRDFLLDLYEELLDAVVYARGLRKEMVCLGNDLRQALVLLAAIQHPCKGELAEVVALLESVLQRNPALHAK